MRKGFRNSVLKGAALSVALMLALPAAGCAGKADNVTTVAQAEGVTSSDVAEQTKVTTEATSDKAQETMQATTTEVETTAAPAAPVAITLDGVKEHHYISDSYCYSESEKYILLVDKDIDLPGDFVVTLDAIVDALEEELGLSSMPEDYYYAGMDDNSIYYDGFDPWENMEPGKKIPILLLADRNAIGRTSGAAGSEMFLSMLALTADDLWKPESPLAQSGWEKPDYIDYSEIAHEMTHVITSRNCTVSKILTEGVADHMMYVVVDKLANQYPSIAETKEKVYRFDFIIPEVVNAETAERIFLEDFHDQAHGDRGAEYVIGRYLCEYLRERFGREFYRTYNDIIKAKHLDYSYGTYKVENAQALVDGMKEAFGEDIFTEFGNWCVEKDVLQHVYVSE